MENETEIDQAKIKIEKELKFETVGGLEFKIENKLEIKEEFSTEMKMESNLKSDIRQTLQG